MYKKGALMLPNSIKKVPPTERELRTAAHRKMICNLNISQKGRFVNNG